MTNREADTIEIRPEFPPPDAAVDGVWQVELDAPGTAARRRNS